MSTPLDASALEGLIDAYCSAWGEADGARRRAILANVWAEGATYTDPTVSVAGAEALSAHIARVQGQYPGACIRRISAVDAHHGVARFAWQLVLADGKRLPAGVDFADIAADGKVQRIVGFFGPLRDA